MNDEKLILPDWPFREQRGTVTFTKVRVVFFRCDICGFQTDGEEVARIHASYHLSGKAKKEAEDAEHV